MATANIIITAPDWRPLNNTWTGINVFQSNVQITAATAASSTGTGALQISAGGLGVNGAVYVGGATVIQNTAESTTTGTGALQVSGGAGVKSNLFVGGNVVILSTIESTNTNTGALQVYGGVGISANLFVEGNAYLFGGIDSTSTNTGTLQVQGGVGLKGNIVTSGNVYVLGTADSTSTNTGSLQVSGGVGIKANLNIGGNVYLLGTVDSTDTGTGSLQVRGGVGVKANLTVGGNIILNNSIISGSSSILNKSSTSGGVPSITLGTSSAIGIYANYQYVISMAVSQDSTRLVALANVNGIGGGPGAGNTLYLSTYTSGSWGAFSALSNFTTGSGYFSVALSNTGARGVVTVQSSATAGRIYYFTWNGTTYSAPALITDSTSRYYRTIDVTPDGSRLIVVCGTGDTASGIYWGDWSGSNYGTLTATLESSNNIMNNCYGIAISPDKSKIAYADTNSRGLYYATWNGTTYTSGTLIGQVVNPANSRAVRFSQDGNIIFYSTLSGTYAVYYTLWNGSSFGTLTGISGLDTNATDNWVLTVDSLNNLYYGRFGAPAANMPINKISYNFISGAQVTVGTTSDIVKVPGFLYCPGTIVQAVVRKTAATTSIPNTSTWTATDVYATITPRFSNSVLLVFANVQCCVRPGATATGLALNFYKDGVADSVTVNGNSNSLNYADTAVSNWYLKIAVSTTFSVSSTASTTIKIYGYVANTSWSSSAYVGSGINNDWGRSEVIIYEIAQ